MYHTMLSGASCLPLACVPREHGMVAAGGVASLGSIGNAWDGAVPRTAAEGERE